MMGLVSLWEKDTSKPPPSALCELSKKVANCETGRGSRQNLTNAGTLTLDFQVQKYKK